MNRSGFSAVATQRVEAPLRRRRPLALAQRRELEGKLTALQKDYAELHAEIFEAAQIHRRPASGRLR